jgi:RecJ-like exonuclease
MSSESKSDIDYSDYPCQKCREKGHIQVIGTKVGTQKVFLLGSVSYETDILVCKKCGTEQESIFVRSDEADNLRDMMGGGG